MNLMKKILAGTLACTTLATSAVALSACSSTAWALKTDNATISSGVYRYCLYYAYYNATALVDDYTQPILSQEINGTPADEWIRNQALEYIKPYLLIEDKMKELNLSLDDTTRYNAEQAAATEWEYYKSSLSDLGMTQEDYQYATYDYQAKYSRVFKAIYGEGGEKEVSRDEMSKYFNENYSDLDYILVSTTKDDGSTMTDDEISDLKKLFNSYAKEINNGDKTIEEVADEYKASLGTDDDTSSEDTSSSTDATDTTDTDSESTDTETNDLLHSVTGAVTTSSYPQAFVTAVDEMKNGQAKTVAMESDGYIALVLKNDIAAAEDTFFNQDDKETYDENVFQILVDMKSNEYIEEMQTEAENYDESKITYNESEYNVDLVALFEPDSVTSSETASEASSSTTSSTSSKEEDTSSAASE